MNYGCNPDFALSELAIVTRWTPVKNLTFSGELMWTRLDQPDFQRSLPVLRRRCKLGNSKTKIRYRSTFAFSVTSDPDCLISV